MMNILHVAPAALLLGALVIIPLRAGLVESKPPEEIERLYQGGHYTQAVEGLEAAVAKTPKQASLHYWLGRSYYELRDYPRAMSSLETAVMIEPDNSEYHDWLGKACGRRAEESNPLSALGLARRTHHEFETAVQLDRSNLVAQRDLIRFLLAAPGIVGGGDDHALQQITALTLVDPVQADLARAEYFAARKRSDQAGEQYVKILQAKPASAGVYFEIAQYFMEHDDADKMEQAVQGAVNTGSTDPRLDYYSGVAMVMAKNHEDAAEKNLRAYLSTVAPSSEFPPQSSAHVWLGKLYEYEGRRGEAVAEYQAALSLDPRNKDLRDTLKRLQQTN
jgi:tetratricopeptide (TPR) repeat protein